MPRKKKTEEKIINEIASMVAEETLQATDNPKVTVGNHSTRVEYPDGKINFQIDWDKLAEEVAKATKKFENK